MPSMPEHARNKLLDSFAGASSAPLFPSNYYLALFTSAPNITTGGGTEVSGNNYSRQLIQDASWGVASTGEKVLDGLVLPGATGSWGTITHWGLMNAATGTAITNFYFMGPFLSSFSVNAGDMPYIPPDQIVITLE